MANATSDLWSLTHLQSMTAFWTVSNYALDDMCKYWQLGHSQYVKWNSQELIPWPPTYL